MDHTRAKIPGTHRSMNLPEKHKPQIEHLGTPTKKSRREQYTSGDDSDDVFADEVLPLKRQNNGVPAKLKMVAPATEVKVAPATEVKVAPATEVKTKKAAATTAAEKNAVLDAKLDNIVKMKTLLAKKLDKNVIVISSDSESSSDTESNSEAGEEDEMDEEDEGYESDVPTVIVGKRTQQFGSQLSAKEEELLVAENKTATTPNEAVMEATGKGRYRGWFFTLNNPLEGERERVMNDLFDDGAVYAVIGNEVCPTTKTPHLQGCAYFKNARVLSSLKKVNKRAHWEVTIDQARAIIYCKKEGKFIERGVPPASVAEKTAKGGQKTKELWEHTLKLAKDQRIDEIDPRLQITHYRNIVSIANAHQSLMLRGTKRNLINWYWFAGPTATGKSLTTRKMCGDYVDSILFNKNPETGKWMDGMEAQNRILVIEDLNPSHGLAFSTHLKVWFDTYQHTVETKGGAKKAQWGSGVVTSNYTPAEIFMAEKDYDPIVRRVKPVWFGTKANMPNDGLKWIHMSALPKLFPLVEVIMDHGEEATFEPAAAKRHRKAPAPQVVADIEEDEQEE